MTHTINVPLAERILGQILAAPARWTQDDWLSRPYAVDQQAPTDTVENCQTSGCFAGWAVVLSGYKTGSGGAGDVHDIPARVRDAWEIGWERGPAEGVVPIGLPVRDVAAVELGLTSDQAGELFAAGNSLRDLYERLARLTEGEIVVPDDLPEWADMGPSALADYFDRMRLDAEDVREDA
jgi:hypothetical protein